MDVKRCLPSSSNKPRKSSKLASEEDDSESILEVTHHQEENTSAGSRTAEIVDLTGDDDVIDLTGDDDDDVIVLFDRGDGAQAGSALGKGTVDAKKILAKKAESKTRNDTMTSLLGTGSGRHISTDGIASEVVDPQDELSSFRDIFTQKRDCTKCGKGIVSPHDLVVFSAEIPPPALLPLLHCVCDACGQPHCRGCFRRLTCTKSCNGEWCSVTTCCAEVRAIALFEVLAGFDCHYIKQHTNASNSKKNPRRRKSTATRSRGTGYSRGPIKSKTAASSYATDEMKTLKSSEWDNLIVLALDSITWLLPSPYSDDAAPYDWLPHPSTGSLISLSFLPELLGSLLINDSVTDWSDRSDVYNSMLKLLRRMADSELTVGTLISERMEKQSSAGLGNWMWGHGNIEWETNHETKKVVRAPPLFDHFKKLTKQCETFLAGASILLEDRDDERIEDMALKATSLCGDMISAHQDMQRVLSVMMRGDSVDQALPNGKGKERDGDVDLEKRYCTACEALAFKYVTLSVFSPSGGLSYSAFHFSSNVQGSESLTRQPSKRLHLIRELSVLSTSLPPGVWVRVDEIRNDVIKVMIAGPEDTPYAGGLFEFDCFIPIEYPDVPPKMNLCTTGFGKVRFNPNLYNNGYVCLSLLGTWDGRPEEKWTSKSTLLQVIISIQSLILVDTPYFNEPGYGAPNRNDINSKNYNKNTALQTVRWAMIDWMQQKHRDGIWADVIANHFSIRREKILKCIRTWEKDDGRFKTYSSSMAGTAYGVYSPTLTTSPGDDAKRNLLEEFEKGCNHVQQWLR